MKKLIFMLLLIGSISSHAQTGMHVTELSKFDNAMLQLISNYNVPGAQLAITYRGRLVYNRGFGYANIASQDSVYPNSLFRIASVSKPITALTCMKLFEQNYLNLDAQVFGTNGILNDEKYQTILDPRDTLITVRMLLQHSGGWNRNISGDPMFNAYNIAIALGVSSPPSAEDVIQYTLQNTMLDFNPGTQSQYSNFGYNVLGRVIEKITGSPYEDYVQENILHLAEINDMHVGFNLAENKFANEVTYYDYPNAPLAYSVYDNSTLVPWPYGGFNLEFMDAHGGWIASAEELVKLVCAFDRYSSRPDILNTATIDTMTKPSANDPYYACGIAVNPYTNWWHMGSLPGTTSEIVRNGSNQLNWALLLNTRDQSGQINAAVDNLVWSVLPSITSWPAHDLFSETSTDLQNRTSPDIEIYPIPAKDIINLRLNDNHQGELVLYLYNSNGQLILSNRISETNESTTVNISNLSSGIYFARINNRNQNILSQKIVIK